MKSLISFFSVIYQFRYTIWVMAVQEIRSKYAGSVLGGIWNIIHPLVMVAIYWFVFSVGFRMKASENIPFLSYFFSAFVAWQSFSEAFVSSSNSLLKNRNLIKKTVFPIQILPLISIISSLLNSIFLIAILLLVLIMQGIYPTLHTLQIFYYLFALSVFCLGLGWFFSAASVLLRDMGQVLTIIIQTLFWSIPLVYNIQMFPQKYHLIWKLNPIYYLTEGFRYSFLYRENFWDHPLLTLYFWSITAFLLVIGGWFFKKVKNDLADTL
jgi:ABC-type polysaccharide/polyol phosphate export permease